MNTFQQPWSSKEPSQGTCWANWGRVKPPLFFRSENSCSDMRRIITMVPAPFYKSYTHFLHNCMIVMATINMEPSFFKLHSTHTGLPTYVCSTLARISFQKVLCLSYRCLGARQSGLFEREIPQQWIFQRPSSSRILGPSLSSLWIWWSLGGLKIFSLGGKGTAWKMYSPNDCFY